MTIRHQVYIAMSVVLVIAGLFAQEHTFYAGAASGAGLVFGYVGAVEMIAAWEAYEPSESLQESDRWSAWESGKVEPRPHGTCPRGTEGCVYADLPDAAGHYCYVPHAPRHVDMD